MLSSSRSTSASVTPLDTSPLLVAKTAPEARKNSKLHVSFKTLAKLKSVDDVDRLRKLKKEWSGERGDGVDDAEAYDQGPSPLVQSRSLVLEEKKSVSFRLTDEQRRRLMTDADHVVADDGPDRDLARDAEEPVLFPLLLRATTEVAQLM